MLPGNLDYVALFVWAASATALAGFALRELVLAGRRFDEFVRELARFNDTLAGSHHPNPTPPADHGAFIRKNL